MEEPSSSSSPLLNRISRVTIRDGRVLVGVLKVWYYMVYCAVFRLYMPNERDSFPYLYGGSALIVRKTWF